LIVHKQHVYGILDHHLSPLNTVCLVTIWRANNTALLKLVVKLNAVVHMNKFIF